MTAAAFGVVMYGGPSSATTTAAIAIRVGIWTSVHTPPTKQWPPEGGRCRCGEGLGGGAGAGAVAGEGEGAGEGLGGGAGEGAAAAGGPYASMTVST
jgi:hypothetical protein